MTHLPNLKEKVGQTKWRKAELLCFLEVENKKTKKKSCICVFFHWLTSHTVKSCIHWDLHFQYNLVAHGECILWGLPSYSWLSERVWVGIWCCSCTHNYKSVHFNFYSSFFASLSPYLTPPSVLPSLWSMGNIETGHGLWCIQVVAVGISNSLRMKCWLACSGSWHWTSLKHRLWPQGPSSS